MEMSSVITKDHTGSKCAKFIAEKTRDPKDSHYPLKMAYDLAVRFKLYIKEK